MCHPILRRKPAARKQIFLGFLAVACLCSCTLRAESTSAFIRGSIFDPHGVPIENIRVVFFTEDWQLISSASTRSDTSGSYISGELPLGKIFVKSSPVYPQPFVFQYWPGAFEHSMAIPVAVFENSTVSGIDFTLPAGDYISGRIVSSVGSPFWGVDLDLYDAEWKWLSYFSAESDETGNYRLGAIPAGSYYLRADPAFEHWHQQQYWFESYYRDSATRLILDEDELTGIDFVLEPGGAFTGRLTQAIGGAAAGCEVLAFSTDWREQPIHTALSDQSGNYVAYGLPPGNYYAKADPDPGTGFAGLYFPNAQEPQNAVSFQVFPMETTQNIDINLPEGNFRLDCSILTPRQTFSSGDDFYMNLEIINTGLPQEQMPVFCIFSFAGLFYFWPGWNPYLPPDHPYIDYKRCDLVEGSTEQIIFEPLTWPGTGGNGIEIDFVAAVVTRGLSELASNPAEISCFFE